MSNVSISKATLESIVAGTMTTNQIVAAAKSALNPTRTFVKIDGRTVEIPGLRGVVWFPFAKLRTMGLTRTYRAVANGRWLPVNEAGSVISSFSWKGSAKPTLYHTHA